MVIDIIIDNEKGTLLVEFERAPGLPDCYIELTPDQLHDILVESKASLTGLGSAANKRSNISYVARTSHGGKKFGMP